MPAVTVPAHPSEASLRRGDAYLAPALAAGRRLRLVNWKRLVKGPSRGFATVTLPNGLTIADVPVLVGRNGGAWATVPGKPLIASDGTHKRDANGKPTYVAILSWPDKSTSDRFSAAVVDLVLSAHPAPLDDGGTI
jgi:hypothetical protein